MISEIENQESIECHKNQETMGFKKVGCIKQYWMLRDGLDERKRFPG